MPHPPSPSVLLRKNLARAIRQGAPWVYRDALLPHEELADGALVEVRTRDRRPLAVGYWDKASPIAVRLLDARPFDPADLVRGRLKAALGRRLARLDRRETTAFRWVHGEADLLPGIHVDLYGDVAAVRFDGDGARAFYRDLPTWLEEVGRELPVRAAIDRQRRQGDARLPDEIEVLENGLRFGVDLAHGQKGGLFLDQRENREEIRARAGGRSVLNLFGYTGGFSVYAAAGGARRTDTVDLAKPAIEAARRNFARNGLPTEQAGFFAADAFAFLAEAAAAGRTWDVVISDPPSFAPKKTALPAARQAYRRLHRMAAAVTAPGGLFCPASCSSHFDRREFLASVDEGVRAARRRWSLDLVRGAGFDHPVIPAFPEGDYLKFAVGRVT
jgi:23S rRNA (cytosine1962-C5)-methyltransferase